MVERRREEREATARREVQELVDLFVKNRALVEATEEGYKALEEGRSSKLEEVKKNTTFDAVLSRPR